MTSTPLDATQPGEFVVVFVTAPDADVAANLAKTLVAEKLVACVNILPGLRSIYAWEGTHSGNTPLQPAGTRAHNATTSITAPA
jgi:hypothetical protein